MLQRRRRPRFHGEKIRWRSGSCRPPGRQRTPAACGAAHATWRRGRRSGGSTKHAVWGIRETAARPGEVTDPSGRLCGCGRAVNQPTSHRRAGSCRCARTTTIRRLTQATTGRPRCRLAHEPCANQPQCRGGASTSLRHHVSAPRAQSHERRQLLPPRQRPVSPRTARPLPPTTRRSARDATALPPPRRHAGRPNQTPGTVGGSTTDETRPSQEV